MSLPTPHSLAEQKKNSTWRKLAGLETFDDVISRAPQEARPFLLSTVARSDSRSIELKNGFVMTFNGVLLDRGDWTYCEPLRLLDGNIKYGDGWERKNNGTFVAPSGLMIDKHLTVVHKNGQTVYPDGTTVMPSGKIHPPAGPPRATVGIIYRPGLSSAQGMQIWAVEEPAIDPAVLATIVPADPSKGIIVPHSNAGPWTRAMVPPAIAGASRDNQQGGLLPPGAANTPQTTTGELQKYVPPHMRGRPATQQQPKPVDKRLSLTVDEIYLATPANLHHLLDACDVKGCDADIWGIPLCIDNYAKATLLPYVQEALKKINNRR